MTVNNSWAQSSVLMRMLRSFTVFTILFLVWQPAANAETKTDSVSFANLQISITQQTGDAPSCQVLISAISERNPLLGGISHMALPDPARIVLDIRGWKLNAPKRFTTAKQGCIERVRFGNHPDLGRIVFDLSYSEEPLYTLSQSGDSLSIVIGAGTPLAGVPQVQNTKTSTPTPRPTRTPTASRTATATRTTAPTRTPTSSPTIVPTNAPTPVPSNASTALPTTIPSRSPTTTLTATSTEEPTKTPTATPTPMPPTPSPEPTEVPTRAARIDVPSRAELKFSVDQVLMELPSGENEVPVRNLLVTNTSEETLHMTARAVAIIDPGTESERDEPTKELLVSPAMFQLEPGAQRRIRLVGDPRSISEIEKVFRVHLAPLQEDFETSIGLQLNGVTAKINIVTALAITVLRAPSDEDERTEVQASWSNESDESYSILQLKNLGNRSVGLVSMKICPRESSDAVSLRGCRDLPSRRIFAGGLLELRVPHGSSVQGLQKIGEEFQALSIDEHR